MPNFEAPTLSHHFLIDILQHSAAVNANFAVFINIPTFEK